MKKMEIEIFIWIGAILASIFSIVSILCGVAELHKLAAEEEKELEAANSPGDFSTEK